MGNLIFQKIEIPILETLPARSAVELLMQPVDRQSLREKLHARYPDLSEESTIEFAAHAPFFSIPKCNEPNEKKTL